MNGLFYPEDTAGVLSYMRRAGLKRGKGGLARAIVAPHGAWEISGALTSAAFAEAGGRTGKKSPSRVIVMGAIHDSQANGLFLSNSHSFQTPLGDIPVDREATGWLESYSPLFTVDDIPHLHEHSIEILLPFVKYYFPRAAIVPILMGQPREDYIRALARALRAVFEPLLHDTLLAISFNTAMHADETAALRMAHECVRLFKEGNYGELCQAFQDGRIVSCGGALFAALLQSGLMDSARPRVPADTFLSAKGEQGGTAYYSAFSFV